MTNIFDLTGKVALVTGGARSIGLALGIGLGQAGAVVCFNCTSEKSREEGLKAYEEAGIKAHGFVADVSDETSVKKMVDEIRESVGVVDILVNNAGINKRVPLAEMEVEDFTRVIGVDLIAPFIVSKAVLPETQPDGTPHPFDRFIQERTPAGRWGSPKDLVGPVVFLASDASDFVNGQVLYVDGGILAYLGK